jgi:hypothetical protein
LASGEVIVPGRIATWFRAALETLAINAEFRPARIPAS